MENKDECLTREEIEDLHQAFNLFANETTGKLDPLEVKEAMDNLGVEFKAPSIYQLFTKLNNESKLKGGIGFDEFIDVVNERLNNSQMKESLKRLFNIFIDDPKEETITSTKLIRIFKEIGDTMAPEEITELMSVVAENGTEITFEEFFEIMTTADFS